jgi:hypothetical protein
MTVYYHCSKNPVATELHPKVYKSNSHSISHIHFSCYTIYYYT